MGDPYLPDGRASEELRQFFGITKPCRPHQCVFPLVCQFSGRACADAPVGPSDEEQRIRGNLVIRD